MKKFMLMALTAVFALSVSAQCPEKKGDCCKKEKTECCKKDKKDCKKNKKDCKKKKKSLQKGLQAAKRSSKELLQRQITTLT